MAQAEPCQGRWSVPWSPVPVPDPPGRPQQGSPDGYDDVLDVPQEAPAASPGDISEGVARHSCICVLPTGKRAPSCPVPSAQLLPGRVWLWGLPGIQQQIHGCCAQSPGGLCQGGHGAACPLRHLSVLSPRWHLLPSKSPSSKQGALGRALSTHGL